MMLANGLPGVMPEITTPVKDCYKQLFGLCLAMLFPIAAMACLSAPIRAEALSDSSPGEMPKAAAASRTLHFSIPSQPLVTVLDRFGEKTGIQFFYNSLLTKGLMSQGVTGNFTEAEALRMLLAGTPLIPTITGPKAITLVLKPEFAVSADVAPIHGPTLHLPTMRVEAPSLTDFQIYATTIRYSILNALQKDATLRSRHFRTVVDVWVSPTGHVRNSELQFFSGDEKVDLAITQIVDNVVIGRSPPLGLPQPVHVKVLSVGVP